MGGIFRRAMASFAAETIVTIGGFKVTGPIVATLLADGVILGIVFGVRKRLALVPGRLQGAVEAVVEFFQSIATQVAGDRAAWIVPWVVTFFLYIAVSNLLGLLPGYETVGLIREHGAEHELVPFLRVNTSDLNATLALAVVSLVATHALAIRLTGLGNYLRRFFSINPVLLFVGIMEIVGELTKLLSLSLRLFGNVHAGHVVLETISSLGAFVLPLPFMALEILVGLVQATIFAMLTLAFMAVLSEPHHDGGGHK
jgi:F-type H+-transporting ATPase subunit a